MRTPLIAASSLAVALLAFGQNQQRPQPQPDTQPPPARAKAAGYVLRPGEGERLPDPRGGVIKVSPESGSRQFSMVMQPLPSGRRIGVHMHERDEEVFFVHKGKGTVTLDDKPAPAEEGSVVFIPPGTWMVSRRTATCSSCG